jgi:squalene cyclase
MLTNDGRCTCEIKSRIAMAEIANNRKKALFTSTLNLKLRKKLVNCYIWSIAIYGAETWTLRAVDQKHPENFEMWCWRRMEKISWTDHVRNGKVLLRVKEHKNILLKQANRRRLTGLITFCV